MRKEYDDGIYVRATSGGWTTEYYPDGDSDTSLEMTGVGEKNYTSRSRKLIEHIRLGNMQRMREDYPRGHRLPL